MNAPPSRVGCRAKIVDMLHSPARTRASAEWLLGQRGTVVGVLRNGTLALLELDGEPHMFPGGVRRWSVHWDDLLVYTVQPGPDDSADGYRLGLTGSGREAVHHAVRPGTVFGACGALAHPLPICGWSLPFKATAAKACPECSHLVRTTP